MTRMKMMQLADEIRDKEMTQETEKTRLRDIQMVIDLMRNQIENEVERDCEKEEFKVALKTKIAREAEVNKRLSERKEYQDNKDLIKKCTHGITLRQISIDHLKRYFRAFESTREDS